MQYKVEVVNSSTFPVHLSSLIEIYQNIFAEPPEFQQWSNSDLEQILSSYLKMGKLAVAIAPAPDHQVVGFCASIPFKGSKLWESSALFSNNPVSLSANFFQECFQSVSSTRSPFAIGSDRQKLPRPIMVVDCF